MDRQHVFPIALVCLLALALALWTSACSSDSSTGPGGGGSGPLTANPPSVSVAVNTNTTVSITGGSGTYSVQASPDTAIARIISLVTNSVGSPAVPVGTLTIRGVTVDSIGTSTTIRDPSSRTVTIPIRVTP